MQTLQPTFGSWPLITVIRRALDFLQRKESGEVFKFAANLENFALWFPGVESITSANSLLYAEVGKNYKETFSSLGSKQKVLVEVKDCQVEKYIITESEFLPVLPRMEISFQAMADNKTEVVWSMVSRNRGLLWAILVPLVKLVMNNRSRKGLTRLREILERT